MLDMYILAQKLIVSSLLLVLKISENFNLMTDDMSTPPPQPPPPLHFE